MLYEYIKKRMSEYPDQTISDGRETLTYSELLNKAEHMGKNLTNNLYALLCGSDLKTAIGLLACLSVNKTAVPLSSKYGINHYEKILKYIQPDGIITDDEIQTINPSCCIDLADTAVVMCSSGTTGVPKGIMLSESNLLSNLMDIEKYMPIDNSDYMLISRPIYHCAVMTSELLYGLIRGAKILFYCETLNPKRMYRIIEDERITVTSATPTIFYYLSKHINSSKLDCSLKTIAISGECMTEIVANEIIKAMPETKKFNVYGLTEASPRVSYLPYYLFDKFPTSVGVPLESVEIKIEKSELLVKGKNVMQGYYKNSTLSRKTIEDDWLHTGDVAEIINGLLYIKCRKDNMIIRAGMNIYPQDIENAIKTDDRVFEAMAYGKKDKNVGEKIILEVVGKELSVAEVFKICRAKLPSFQYPDSIKIVSKLEHTASGKIVRKRNVNA